MNGQIRSTVQLTVPPGGPGVGLAQDEHTEYPKAGLSCPSLGVGLTVDSCIGEAGVRGPWGQEDGMTGVPVHDLKHRKFLPSGVA